jgi:hypothetical protein
LFFVNGGLGHLFRANGRPMVPRWLRRWPSACQTATPLFKLFWFLKFFFGKFGEWARPFRRTGVQHPHFLKLVPTLGGVKSSIPHGAWSFFFPQIFFLKLKNTWTFICIVGILVLWKSEFSKNSSRIASVMEMFCILLQCKVHLSMFHSSPTSKIWYTCT